MYGLKLELGSVEFQLGSGRKRTQNTSRRLDVCIVFANSGGGGQGRHYDDSEAGQRLLHGLRFRAPAGSSIPIRHRCARAGTARPLSSGSGRRDFARHQPYACMLAPRGLEAAAWPHLPKVSLCPAFEPIVRVTSRRP